MATVDDTELRYWKFKAENAQRGAVSCSTVLIPADVLEAIVDELREIRAAVDRGACVMSPEKFFAPFEDADYD